MVEVEVRTDSGELVIVGLACGPGVGTETEAHRKARVARSWARRREDGTVQHVLPTDSWVEEVK